MLSRGKMGLHDFLRVPRIMGIYIYISVDCVSVNIGRQFSEAQPQYLHSSSTIDSQQMYSTMSFLIQKTSTDIFIKNTRSILFLQGLDEQVGQLHKTQINYFISF